MKSEVLFTASRRDSTYCQQERQYLLPAGDTVLTPGGPGGPRNPDGPDGPSTPGSPFNPGLPGKPSSPS